MSKLKEIALGRSDLFRVYPSNIEVEDGYNVRDEYDLSELKASILANGVKDPLSVIQKEGKIILRKGHRRLQACMELIEEGYDIESVLVQPVRLNKEDEIVDLITSNDGKPLLQHEQGRVFLRLKSMGHTLEYISEKTGKSIPHVSNCIQLAEAPVEVQQAINAGQISPSMALSLGRNKKPEKFVELVKREIEKAQAQGKKKATGKTQNSDKIKFSKEDKEFLIEHVESCDLGEAEIAHAVQVLKRYL